MSIQTTTPFLNGLSARRNRIERFLVAAHELPGMSVEQRIDVIEEVVTFLAETLLPHEEASERVLSGESGGRFAREGVRGPVAFDRDAIRARIHELAETNPRRTGRLQELLYALHLLCANDLQKEEELYLLMLDKGPGTMEKAMGAIAALENAHGNRSAPLQPI